MNDYVVVRKQALDKRPDLQHYQGQTGLIRAYQEDEEYVMVFWSGLSCSSIWARKELRPAVGTEIPAKA